MQLPRSLLTCASRALRDERDHPAAASTDNHSRRPSGAAQLLSAIRGAIHARLRRVPAPHEMQRHELQGESSVLGATRASVCAMFSSLTLQQLLSRSPCRLQRFMPDVRCCRAAAPCGGPVCSVLYPPQCRAPAVVRMTVPPRFVALARVGRGVGCAHAQAVWGGEPELQAMSELYQRPIVVFSQKQNGEACVEAVHVFFQPKSNSSGSHFVRLLSPDVACGCVGSAWIPRRQLISRYTCRAPVRLRSPRPNTLYHTAMCTPSTVPASRARRAWSPFTLTSTSTGTTTLLCPKNHCSQQQTRRAGRAAARRRALRSHHGPSQVRGGSESTIAHTWLLLGRPGLSSTRRRPAVA